MCQVLRQIHKGVNDKTVSTHKRRLSVFVERVVIGTRLAWIQIPTSLLPNSMAF
jgi:hypothetical protein